MNTVILEAFIAKFEELSFSPALPVLWPSGVKKAPPATGMWLEVMHFPSSPENVAWDAGSPVNARGYFQIGIGYRPNVGIIQPSLVADQVVENFPYGFRLYGDVGVIKTPWASPAIIESDKIYIPVTIQYAGLIK